MEGFIARNGSSGFKDVRLSCSEKDAATLFQVRGLVEMSSTITSALSFERLLRSLSVTRTDDFLSLYVEIRVPCRCAVDDAEGLGCRYGPICNQTTRFERALTEFIRSHAAERYPPPTPPTPPLHSQQRPLRIFFNLVEDDVPSLALIAQSNTDRSLQIHFGVNWRSDALDAARRNEFHARYKPE